MKKLKSDSPIPLYYQLREIIRDKIISSEWEYGAEIPSELKLCDEFNLCRATVKQALDGLVNEGLIVRRKGKGSFVVYQKLNDNILLEPAFSSKSEKENKDNYTKLIFADFSEPDNFLKKILNLSDTDLVYQIERLHYIDGLPVALDTHYIHSKWAETISKEDIGKLVIHKYLENTHDIVFSNYKVNIQAVLLDQYEREEFDFPEIETGIIVESLSFVQKEAVMFNRKIYRGDRCNLALEFNSINNKLEVTNSEISIESSVIKRR